MQAELPAPRRGEPDLARRLAATLVAALFLLPLLWAVSGSLHETGAATRRIIDWIPSPAAWGNYVDVFARVGLHRYAANSLLVAAAAVPTTVLVASWAGFAISQLPARWQLRLVLLSLACLMVPLTAIWLPRFILFKEAGLVDHRLALAVPALMGTSPFYALLFAWAFARLPREVYEAGRLDGAAPFRLWREIGLPQVRPAVVAVAVLSFVHYWNSFIEPLLLIRSDEKKTASLGLRVLASLDRTDWPIVLSGAIVVLAPVLVVFVLAQRAFIQEPPGGSAGGR